MGHLVLGALVMASWTTALFFLRFWRTTRDRFFAFFAVTFAVLGVNWLGLALVDPAGELQTYFYVLRLLAFVILLVAILDKNRRSTTPPDQPS
jgi:hypothetical protein